MKRHALLLILGALFMVWGNDSWAARTTRDLVFDDEEPAQTQAMESSGKQTTALKTTMLLKRDGATSTVLPTHEFKSGDSVKLVFTPNIDGYVYWLAKGSSGSYSVLFPSRSIQTTQYNVTRNTLFPPRERSALTILLGMKNYCAFCPQRNCRTWTKPLPKRTQRKSMHKAVRSLQSLKKKILQNVQLETLFLTMKMKAM